MSGLVYDERMVAHEDIPGCEIGERIISIYKRLQREGLVSKCVNVAAREATTAELLRVHTRKHIAAIDKLESMTDDEIRAFESKLNSIKLNQQTPLAARLAAGGLIDLCLKVSVTNELDNGFAIIRPPGHHCESCLPFGFCLYSNVAIAIRAIHERKADTKVMVVDWDVHHGNSTQHQFWHDERVLYFSLHRYDNAHMFPGAACADLDRIGAEDAAGYNCNIPFSDYADTVGDKEYMYAWEQVLIPLAKSFQPNLIIVSCGFDSARGDPLGGFDLTPTCYGHMTRILQNLVEGGKVVLALEGGYNLNSISASGAACVRALLGEKLSALEMEGTVDCASVRIIDDCRHIHEHYLLKGDDNNTTKEAICSDLASKFSQETGSGTNEQICGELTTISNGNSKKAPLPIDDDGGLNMLGYQIQPLRKCKHTDSANDNPQVELRLNDLLKCSVENCEFGTMEGDDLLKNDNHLTNMWICVTCLKTFCGRSLNAHGIKHAQDTGHFVLLGYDDLSCWCYGASDGCPGGCDNYVDPFAIEKLRPVFNSLHHAKFGVNASFPKSTRCKSNGQAGDETIDNMALEFSLTLEIVNDDQTTDGVIESKK
jgi:histone deacetylase 6